MTRQTFKSNNLLAVTSVLTLAVLVVMFQVWHPARRVGHDTWYLLPVQDWRVGHGEWDGLHSGGGVYDYGFIERLTNTQ